MSRRTSTVPSATAFSNFISDSITETITSSFPPSFTTDITAETVTATNSRTAADQNSLDWNWNKVGLIAGIIAGSIAGIILLAAFVSYAFKYKQTSSSESPAAKPEVQTLNKNESVEQYAWFSFSRNASAETIARMRVTQPNLNEEYMKMTMNDNSPVVVSKPFYDTNANQEQARYSYMSTSHRTYDRNSTVMDFYPPMDLSVPRHPSGQLPQPSQSYANAPFASAEPSYYNNPYPSSFNTSSDLLHQFSGPYLADQTMNLVPDNQNTKTDAYLSQQLEYYDPNEANRADQDLQQHSFAQPSNFQPLQPNNNFFLSDQIPKESPEEISNATKSDANNPIVVDYADHNNLNALEISDENISEGSYMYPLRPSQDVPVKIVDKLFAANDEN